MRSLPHLSITPSPPGCSTFQRPSSKNQVALPSHSLSVCAHNKQPTLTLAHTSFPPGTVTVCVVPAASERHALPLLDAPPGRPSNTFISLCMHDNPPSLSLTPPSHQDLSLFVWSLPRLGIMPSPSWTLHLEDQATLLFHCVCTTTHPHSRSHLLPTRICHCLCGPCRVWASRPPPPGCSTWKVKWLVACMAYNLKTWQTLCGAWHSCSTVLTRFWLWWSRRYACVSVCVFELVCVRAYVCV